MNDEFKQHERGTSNFIVTTSLGGAWKGEQLNEYSAARKQREQSGFNERMSDERTSGRECGSLAVWLTDSRLRSLISEFVPCLDYRGVA